MTKDQLIEELKKRLIEYSDTGYYSSDYSAGVRDTLQEIIDMLLEKKPEK